MGMYVALGERGLEIVHDLVRSIIAVQNHEDFHCVSEQVATQPRKRLNLMPVGEPAERDDGKSSLASYPLSPNRSGDVPQDLHVVALDKQGYPRAKCTGHAEIEAEGGVKPCKIAGVPCPS
jgi:hypothetical protein